jgi:hypothetical protein
MTEPVDSTVRTAEGARNIAILVLQQARLMIADGKSVRIRCHEAKDTRSTKQNAFLWAGVYSEISLQARICGERWVAEAYHELFKRMFLGYRYERQSGIAGVSQDRAIRVLRSTTELSVKEMSEYIEKVLAFGVTDLGVTFRTMDWSEWERLGGRA